MTGSASCGPSSSTKNHDGPSVAHRVTSAPGIYGCCLAIEHVRYVVTAGLIKIKVGRPACAQFRMELASESRLLTQHVDNIVFFDGSAPAVAERRAQGDAPLQAAYLLARLIGVLDGLKPDSPDCFVPLRGLTQDAVARVVNAVDEDARGHRARHVPTTAPSPASAVSLESIIDSDARLGSRGLRIAVLRGVSDDALTDRVRRLKQHLMSAIEFCLIDSFCGSHQPA